MTERERLYRALLIERLADIARHLLQTPTQQPRPAAPINLADFHRAPRRVQ